MFTEYTYTHTPTGTELYVHRDEKGKVIRLYCYCYAFFLTCRKGAYKFDPEYIHGKRASLCKLKVSDNPLFIDIKPADAALDLLIDHGFSSQGEDPHEDR